MAYAVTADLIDRYGEREVVQLTDRADPPAGVVDAAVGDRALADASAEIDLYLTTRFTVPVDPAPAILKVLACTLARFRLARDPAEGVRKDYDAAVRSLMAIANGNIALPGATGAGVVQLAEGEPPALTQAALRGF